MLISSTLTFAHHTKTIFVQIYDKMQPCFLFLCSCNSNSIKQPFSRVFLYMHEKLKEKRLCTRVHTQTFSVFHIVIWQIDSLMVISKYVINTDSEVFYNLKRVCFRGLINKCTYYLFLQGHRLEQVLTSGFLLEIVCSVPMLATVGFSSQILCSFVYFVGYFCIVSFLL